MRRLHTFHYIIKGVHGSLCLVVRHTDHTRENKNSNSQKKIQFCCLPLHQQPQHHININMSKGKEKVEDVEEEEEVEDGEDEEQQDDDDGSVEEDDPDVYDDDDAWLDDSTTTAKPEKKYDSHIIHSSTLTFIHTYIHYYIPHHNTSPPFQTLTEQLETRISNKQRTSSLAQAPNKQPPGSS